MVVVVSRSRPLSPGQRNGDRVGINMGMGNDKKKKKREGEKSGTVV